MLKDVANRNSSGRMGAHLNQSVVIADDNVELLAALEHLIRDNGIEVTTTVDGLQALQLCRRLHPRVIVLDVLMPHMSGTELLDSLREDPNLRYAYVIMFSGIADSASELAALTPNADRHFVKPVDPDVLADAIEDGLATGRTRGGLLGRIERR